jgi:hypothetical protein
MPTLDLTIDAAGCLAQAVVHLRQAMELIEHVAPGALQAFDPGNFATLFYPPRPSPAAAPSGNGAIRPPITDRATYSARWANRTCCLGNTQAFKLLERLARRPNLLISCDSLLDDLWDRHTSPEAVRSAVKILRRKLRAAGMEDLAEAIDGGTAHHYGLMLDRVGAVCLGNATALPDVCHTAVAK